MTVLMYTHRSFDRSKTRADLERSRQYVERWYQQEGDDEDWLAGVEAIMFIGPAVDHTYEVWQVHEFWDVERRAADTVIVVHPDRHYWQRQDDYETEYRSQVEMTVPEFARAARDAHQGMLDDYGGRIDGGKDFVDDKDLPHLVTDAGNLHSYYVEVGAVNHPDGPPVLPPPITCGLVQNNDNLLADCEVLLSNQTRCAAQPS